MENIEKQSKRLAIVAYIDEKTKKYLHSHDDSVQYTPLRIISYFIIYSFIGYVLEVIFAILTKGVLESRQGFIYGPFCPIYGIGAVMMILTLKFFTKNNIMLFIGGTLVGSFTEYFLSFLGDKIFNMKWWDYSNFPLNINGRICVYYSLFWGLLALFLLRTIQPKIDKLIDWIITKVSANTYKGVVTILLILLFINLFLTLFAFKMFIYRIVDTHNIDIVGFNKISMQNSLLYNNPVIYNFANFVFSDSKMLLTYPNLRVQDTSGNIIDVTNLYPNIKTYYFKFP